MCRERVEDLDLLAVGGNTSRSIAPEVLSGRGAHGRAVDMYAFGVILAELDSHELPFSDITLSSGAALSEVAMLELLSTGALQPSISPDCPQDIALLILDCLTFDANRRPTAALALQRLQVVLDSFDALGSGHDDSARRRAGSYLDEKEDDDDDDTAAYTI
jgi:serine/threonine protein kinase